MTDKKKLTKSFGYELPDGRFVNRREAVTYLRSESLKAMFPQIPQEVIDLIAQNGGEVAKALEDADRDLG